MRRGALLLIVCLMGAGTAWAVNPVPPGAETGGSSGVGTSAATVTGTVTSGGDTATWQFEYGTSTDYGLTSTSGTVPASTNPQTVTAALSALTQATTYHYRLTATNPAGVGRGDDKTFRTLAPPTAVTAAASAISASGATLNGTVNPQGAETTYRFEYGKTKSYGSTTDAASAGAGTTSTPVKQAITGLSPSTTYHFRIVATNASGTVQGNDRSFRTGAGPSKPAVGTGGVKDVSATGATLTGSVNPRGQATTYHFQYGRTRSYGQVTPEQSAGSATSGQTVTAAITDLVPNAAYHYRIVATNPTGTSVGNDHSFRTSKSPLSFRLGAGTGLIVFGRPAVLSGVLAGSGGGGRPVTLQSKPFPFSGAFTPVGNPQVTLANGSFRFVVPGLPASTRFVVTTKVGAATLTSSTVTVRVRVRVGFFASHVSARVVRFRGTVRPALSSGSVSIQRRTRSGGWTRVTRAGLRGPAAPGGPSTFAKRVRLHRGGVFRAVVSPNDGGAHVRNRSRTRAVHVPR